MLSRTLAALLSCTALIACAPAAKEMTAKQTAVAPVAFTPGEMVMRRLSAEQYQNIVTDVFGPSIELGGRFEPDLRVGGLLAVGAGTVSITAVGMEQFDAMARNIAAQVVSDKNRALMVPCLPADPKAADDACVGVFMSRVGELLYRRPLTGDELKSYVGVARLATGSTKDFYAGLSTSLAAMLSSPKFLFRQELVTANADGTYSLDGYSKASQLSFFLWNSIPDLPLLAAARKGELNTRAGIARQVERMMTSPRLEHGVRAFFIDNFGFDEFNGLTKDAVLFPKFSAQAANDAQEQTLRTIVDLLLKNKGDYRDIFTTKKTFLTQELGAIYQVPVVDGSPNGSPDAWLPFEFAKDDPRGGILTQMSFTSLHSPPGRGSPTLRGKALREVLLCQKVPAPPANVKFDIVQDTNNPIYKTARDRLNAHAINPVCAGCHKIIDPLGLALENFDGAGAFRTTEQGVKIDTSGALDGVKFTGAAELGRVVHDNPAATACLVSRLTSYAVGRDVKDTAWLEALKAGFAANGYRLPDLMRAIATSDAFFTVAAPKTQTASAQ